MAKNLASVKPVKGYGWHYNGQLSGEMRATQVNVLYIPVTLLTTARYKKLMAVVNAVVRYWPGTPKPLDLPGHARWAAEDWQVWAREHARQAA